VATRSSSDDRWISLGSGAVPIPERLLLSHSRGETLFVTGAGTSMPSGLPDFRRLVLDAYAQLDIAAHGALATVPTSRTPSGLTEKQVAEMLRFDRGDFDVVLGMLERRLDGAALASSQVRHTLSALLRSVTGPSGRTMAPKPSPLHRALVRLADRGVATTIATTNFDRLLQAAASGRVPTYALGGIPRPGRTADFSGVLHIHGVLNRDASLPSDLVVTDRDFGEFYLRRRVVPDLIYDAARLFSIVLVGYSANDAPMRYLLNAVAADGSRFDDLRERFAFVAAPTPDEPSLEDWRGRGITPIPYDRGSNHVALATTLCRWAELSSVNGSRRKVDALVKRIVRTPRSVAPDSDKDLFDHLVRRNPSDRLRLSALISRVGASFDWLDAIVDIELEPRRGGIR
jgi:hypothetical protein